MELSPTPGRNNHAHHPPAKIAAAGFTAAAKLAAKRADAVRVVVALIPEEGDRVVPGLRLTATNGNTVAVVRVPLAMTEAEVEPYLGSTWTLDAADAKVWGSAIKAGLRISPDTTPDALVGVSGAVTLLAPNVETDRPWSPGIDALVGRVMEATRDGRDRTAEQLLVIDPKMFAGVLNMAGAVSRGGVIVHPGVSVNRGARTDDPSLRPTVEQIGTVVVGDTAWWSVTAPMYINGTDIAASRTW